MIDKTKGAAKARAAEVACENCIFFSEMSPTTRDRWTGICQRFPAHVAVTKTHSCGEFRRYWATATDDGRRPEDARPVLTRGVRPTQETRVGNWLVELTALEAAIVEWALRLQVFELQLSDGVTHSEIKDKLAILCRVVERFPSEADRDRSVRK